MRWYNYLYIGEKAAKNSNRIIDNIKKGKLQIDKYVLALPFNDSDMLDIYPAGILVQKHYLKSDIVIIGIADGMEEAKDLMQEVIMECFIETKGFKLKDYILAGGVSG